MACGSTSAKRALIRVVRTPTGDVQVDPSGKAAGRGAYLCPRSECIALALKKRALERSLKVPVPAALRAALEAAAAAVPAPDGPTGPDQNG